MNYKDARITKLREYLLKIIDTLTTKKDYQINANMLSNDINNYSLDKIPEQTIIEKWITGVTIEKDVFSFRSRNSYSMDTINNLKNIGFFEIFEETINSNNKKGILPDIKGIESIKCLNNASMISADTKTAEFEIQIQITFRKEI